VRTMLVEENNTWFHNCTGRDSESSFGCGSHVRDFTALKPGRKCDL